MVFSGLKSRKGKENLSTPTSNPSLSNQQDENGAVYDAEKTGEEDNSPYPRLTFRTFVMTVLAAMGGFVFVRLRLRLKMQKSILIRCL